MVCTAAVACCTLPPLLVATIALTPSALAPPLRPAPVLADGVALAEEELGGFFRVAQYGSVFTLPSERLNEMMLRVTGGQSSQSRPTSHETGSDV